MTLQERIDKEKAAIKVGTPELNNRVKEVIEAIGVLPEQLVLKVEARTSSDRVKIRIHKKGDEFGTTQCTTSLEITSKIIWFSNGTFDNLSKLRVDFEQGYWKEVLLDFIAKSFANYI
jgi:hypothetical protein